MLAPASIRPHFSVATQSPLIELAMTTTRSAAVPHGYVLSRSGKDDKYSVWAFDPTTRQPLSKMTSDPAASFPAENTVISIGDYFLDWGPMQGTGGTAYWDWSLRPMRIDSDDVLSTRAVQIGRWEHSQLFGTPMDFGNPEGGHKAFQSIRELTLVPLGTFLLAWMPTLGRGTYKLWNFDPCPTDPGSVGNVLSYFTPLAGFRDIEAGHELVPFNNYVLEREKASSRIRLFSFDPQNRDPLSYPAVADVRESAIPPTHSVVAIGEYLLDWSSRSRKFRVWRVSPSDSAILQGPVAAGTLPDGFDARGKVTGFQPRQTPPAVKPTPKPGTVEFMRSKVKHVVYYMLENRSFDHVVGWLHEKNPADVHVIGQPGPYDGARSTYTNEDPSQRGNPKIPLSKFQKGKLDPHTELEMFSDDPYHDLPDTLRQFFYRDVDGYAERRTPNMGGFIWNNGTQAVMQTFTPTQLPVLNGLAGDFAVSDRWFASMPACTDVNRAFSLTGSSMGEVDNFMSPPQLIFWPEQWHRPSIFKLLWCNGITDWRIYHSTEWLNTVFTYQLFLKGQIPTVDHAIDAAATKPGASTPWISTIDQFYKDALAGKLPSFSMLEPIWIGGTGPTSYHPGADIVPGETQLNMVYDAISKGPGWEETMLVITFDEHGGAYDHVPPPYGVRPWPRDENDGFRFDLFGPRVPTIVVSPHIEPKTVFRSDTPTDFDSTSFLSTLLTWYGIPRERWYLGDRTAAAPTFETVLTREAPRDDVPAYVPPYDKNYPREGPATPRQKIGHLAELAAHAFIVSATTGKLPPAQIRALSHDVLTTSRDMLELRDRIDAIVKKYS